MEKMRHFKLNEGTVYENAGGGFYRCNKVIDRDSYEVVNVYTGWTCIVHVITYYEDGCIEWDSSSMGHWDETYKVEV